MRAFHQQPPCKSAHFPGGQAGGLILGVVCSHFTQATNLPPRLQPRHTDVSRKTIRRAPPHEARQRTKILQQVSRDQESEQDKAATRRQPGTSRSTIIQQRNTCLACKTTSAPKQSSSLSPCSNASRGAEDPAPGSASEHDPRAPSPLPRVSSTRRRTRGGCVTTMKSCAKAHSATCRVWVCGEGGALKRWAWRAGRAGEANHSGFVRISSVSTTEE